MKKPIPVHQKSRGRPATGRDPAVTIRLPETVLASVEHWAMSQKDQPPRSQAIRRLIELGLTGETKVPPSQRLRSAHADRAKDLASKAIDKITDSAVPRKEKALRKRRLTRGPTEFRDDRVDQPTAKVK